MQIMDVKERNWELHPDFGEQMHKKPATACHLQVINKETSIQDDQNKERTATSFKVKKVNERTWHQKYQVCSFLIISNRIDKLKMVSLNLPSYQHQETHTSQTGQVSSIAIL